MSLACYAWETSSVDGHCSGIELLLTGPKACRPISVQIPIGKVTSTIDNFSVGKYQNFVFHCRTIPSSVP